MATHRRVVTVVTSANARDEALAIRLAERGVALEYCDDATSALMSIGRSSPQLVIVPTDVVGIEPLAMIEALAHQPIAVLVALAPEPASSAIAVGALDRGAAAIVGLPLSITEIEAALSRHTRDRAQVLRAGELVMDLDAYRVTVRGHEVQLSAREFALLRRLLESPRHLVSLDELETLAASESPGSLTAIRVMIARIRRKLESISPEGERLVETVRGVGYRIADEPDAR